MTKYCCPVCHKSYDTIDELIKCLEADKKKAEIDAAKSREAFFKEIEADKEDIKKTYALLKKKVDEYNTKARICYNYGKSDFAEASCSLSFNSICYFAKGGWITDTLPKTQRGGTGDSENLNDLIHRLCGF